MLFIFIPSHIRHVHSLTTFHLHALDLAISSFLHQAYTPLLEYLYMNTNPPAGDLPSSTWKTNQRNHQDRLNNFMDNVICARPLGQHMEHYQAYTLEMCIPYRGSKWLSNLLIEPEMCRASQSPSSREQYQKSLLLTKVAFA